jgi:hypothetical protein
MKTAQEVLQEERAVRIQREARDGKWAELAKRWRSPYSWHARVWSSSLMFLVAVIPLVRPVFHGDVLSICILAAALLLFCVLLYAADQQKRKETALLAIIEQEAPQLFQKLEDEKIA